MILRRLVIGAAVLSIVAVAVAFALGLRLTPLVLRSFDPDAALVAAERYDVEVTRDAYGVPRIIGETSADAAFGLAFAHAEDDFPTVQEGLRLALGPDMLAGGESEARLAYLIQAMGTLSTVEARYDALSAEARAYVEAYADGLNLYAALHPGEAARDLFPVSGPDVVAASAFTSPLFYGMSRTLSELMSSEAERDLSRGQELQVFWEAAAGVELGSNAIAVAPGRSEDGVTRLIVNSHQPLDGPLAWYEAHLIARDGLEFAGGVFPGGPFLHLGGNQDFATAATVNSPDLIDVYALELAEDGEGYLLDGEARAFEREEARVLVHLFGPFAWRAAPKIERSVHGPVLRTPRGPYAVRFATMDDLTAVDQTYRMMHARSVPEYEAALRMGAMGSTNRLVADDEGRIARYYNARLPDRSAAPSLDWEEALPGDRGDLVWTGFVPFGALPHMVDPEAGYVLDSNHSPFRVTLTGDDPRAEDYPSWYGVETSMTNRAYRATELMANDDDERTSREELLAVKYDDVYDPRSLAMTLREQLLASEAAEDPQLAQAIAVIEAWDGRADGASREAALSLMTYQPIGVALFLGNEPPALEASFRDAVAYLTEHHGRLDPPWREVNRLRRGDVDVGLEGGPDTLRAVNSAPAGDGTLVMNSGDGLTMLWEALPDGETRLFAVHQYGASARPHSPHYTDQMALFAEERFREVPLGEEAVRAAAVETYRPGAR